MYIIYIYIVLVVILLPHYIGIIYIYINSIINNYLSIFMY